MTANADLGPKFGPEFTVFSPDDAQKSLDRGRLLDRMQKHLIADQFPGAKFIFSTNANVATPQDRFQSPNGWSFLLTFDPGVIEFKMPPMVVEEYQKYAGDIQDAIFVSAVNENLRPALFAGGGHINVDVNWFSKWPPLILRNFIVDLVNHSSLGMGIWGYETANALSYSLSPSMLDDFRYILGRFDRGDYGPIHIPDESTNHKFLMGLDQRMTVGADSFRAAKIEKPGSYARGTKFMEVSFKDSWHETIPEQNRIELRTFRPQTSVDVWVRQISLIRDRIMFLAHNVHKPIPLRPSFTIPVKTRDQAIPLLYDPPMPAQAALREYYQFVTETGHKWTDHRDYLWPAWVHGRYGHLEETPELQKFENSDWFLEREGCKNLLSGAA